ncbi:zinc finger MYM-type protein 1-like [Cucumis melo var. makuwa]|uniref:Zinc finger MYM-type protein 1-like n=1 Tax=Cucumis melo var. makuwa TaxID=1194695 RepID=A0A5D3C0N1_CUCMM|nr:zinc finger MYM-type protein 1-like [Cucumis melo var. makuwa]
MLREKHSTNTFEALNNGELSSGRGLNQETMIKRPGDTRWGSHYITFVRCISIFSSICELMRESGWQSLLDEVSSFCNKHGILMLKMDDAVTPRIFEVDPLSVDSIEGHNRVSGKGFPTTGPRSEAGNVVVHRGLHTPMLDVWYSVVMLTGYVVDWNCMSMDLEVTVTRMATEDVRAQRGADRREAGRTREGHMDASGFLIASAIQKLICLAQFYPRDFSTTELLILEDQLQNYIIDVCSDNMFVGLTSIGDLSQKMVITAKDKVYPLVYRLLTLALILPVTMATVERKFSAMSVIKIRLRNRIENQ